LGNPTGEQGVNLVLTQRSRHTIGGGTMDHGCIRARSEKKKLSERGGRCSGNYKVRAVGPCGGSHIGADIVEPDCSLKRGRSAVSERWRDHWSGQEVSKE